MQRERRANDATSDADRAGGASLIRDRHSP